MAGVAALEPRFYLVRKRAGTVLLFRGRGSRSPADGHRSIIAIVRAQDFFSISTSSVMATLLPTTASPVPSAVFQTRLKSLRLILVVAETPRRVLPQGSLIAGVGPSTSKVTSCVTP